MAKRGSGEGTASKLVGAFEQAFEALGAKPKLVSALRRTRQDILPCLGELAEDAEHLVDAVTKPLEGEPAVTDAEFEEEPEDAGEAVEEGEQQ